MKHTARSGRLWVTVDNIQCSPDRKDRQSARRPKRIPEDAVIHYPPDVARSPNFLLSEEDKDRRDLINAFRS